MGTQYTIAAIWMGAAATAQESAFPLAGEKFWMEEAGLA
jgi:hypothetical protein